MKKVVLLRLLIISLLIISLIGMIGCSDDSTGDTSGNEEGSSVSEEPAQKELYIMSSGYWSHPPWQQAKFGGQSADEFLGPNVTVEFPGPEGADIDGMLAALEASIAKNPDGIIWLPFNIGEGPLLTKYHEQGGLIANWVGVEDCDYPVDMVFGIDNFEYGRDLAHWMIETMGNDEFKLAINTVSDHPIHIERVQGIMSVVDEHPGMEVVYPIIEETITPEGAAENASAYIAAHPEVNAFIGTGAMSGAAMARAAKEAGYEKGEKKIIAVDQDPELVQFVKDGWIVGSLGSSFGVEIFYAVYMMHAIKNGAMRFTNQDEKAGFQPYPVRIITPVYRYTAENIDALSDMPSPK